MAKYILKESELVTVLEIIVNEELKNFGKKILRGGLNLAKNAAVATVAPQYFVGRTAQKMNGGKSVGNILFGDTNYQGRTSTANKNISDKKGEKDTTSYTKESIVRKFGEPAVTGLGGKNLRPKENVRLVFGSSGEIDFGEHYLERDNRVWREKLKRMNEKVQRTTDEYKLKEYKNMLEEWLYERDQAYETYARLK